MATSIDAETYAQAASSLFRQRGRIEYTGALARVAATVPQHVAAYVEAVSDLSGMNRSRVIAHLLEVGIRSVREHMPKKDDAEIMALSAEKVRAMDPKSEQGVI